MRSVRLSTNQLPARGSTVAVTPLSLATICCVRRAILTESSEGRARASSRLFVWRL